MNIKNIKNIIAPENVLKFLSAGFAIGSLVVANKKEKLDMNNLKDNVVKDVMDRLSNNE